jgi:hypothetical protein
MKKVNVIREAIVATSFEISIVEQVVIKELVEVLKAKSKDKNRPVWVDRDVVDRIIIFLSKVSADAVSFEEARKELFEVTEEITEEVTEEVTE